METRRRELVIIFHGGQSDQEKISESYKGGIILIEPWKLFLCQDFDKKHHSGKENNGHKDGFSENSDNKQKMVRHKKLVASRLIKARLTHMKDREGHLCSVHKNIEEWVRSDRFGRFRSQT